MLEAGHDRAPGDADGGGQGSLGRDTGVFGEHPTVDGIQECSRQPLVAGSWPFPPTAENDF